MKTTACRHHQCRYPHLSKSPYILIPAQGELVSVLHLTPNRNLYSDRLTWAWINSIPVNCNGTWTLYRHVKLIWFLLQWFSHKPVFGNRLTFRLAHKPQNTIFFSVDLTFFSYSDLVILGQNCFKSCSISFQMRFWSQGQTDLQRDGKQSNEG